MKLCSQSVGPLTSLHFWTGRSSEFELDLGQYINHLVAYQLMLQSNLLSRDNHHISKKLTMLFWDKTKSIWVAVLHDLYVMRWRLRFLRHVLQRTVIRQCISISGTGLSYQQPPCTSLQPEPILPPWSLKSPYGMRKAETGVIAVMARSS